MVAVTNTTSAVAKQRSEKNSGLYRMTELSSIFSNRDVVNQQLRMFFPSFRE